MTDSTNADSAPPDHEPILSSDPKPTPPSPPNSGTPSEGVPPAETEVPDSGTAPDESMAQSSEPSLEEKHARFSEFADFITSCTLPKERFDKWPFLGCDDRLRIDMDPAEFVAVLEEKCDAEFVLDCGLYERIDGEPQLAKRLEGDVQLYVEIDEQNRTCRFSDGNEDYLFPVARTALEYALELNPPESRQDPLALFIVSSVDDVGIMRRLGLQAVSVEGLRSLNRVDVHGLFAGDYRSDFRWRYHSLLVDFDVVRLTNSPMPTIAEVIDRLADAEELYGIKPARRFGVCRPKEAEFQILERAISFGDSALVRQQFETWAETAKIAGVNNWRAQSNPEAPSFSVATAALTSALQKTNGVRRRADVSVALPAYRAAGRGQLLKKFHAAIDNLKDPFYQLDLMAAASHAEAFLDSDPLVRAAELVLDGQTPPSVRELNEELFAQRLSYMAELRRISNGRKTRR